MNGWRDIKLKEVSEYVTVGFVGSMADQYVEGGVPFLRSLNIQPFRLNYNDLKYIPESFHDAIKKSKLRPGDVAIVRTGYPGTACVIPADLPDANCSDLVILRPGPELNPHYIAAVFNSSFGQNLVGGNLVGAAQQHFNVTVAKELKVRLPPRDEQDKIAAVLVGLNDLIANNQRRIALLESMAEEIYREWFVRMRCPVDTAKNVDSKRLMNFDHFCELQRGFDLPDADMQTGDVPVIASTSIKGFHNVAKVKPPVITTGRSGSLGAVLYVRQPAWPLNTSLWVKDFKGNSPNFIYFTLRELKLEQFNAGAGVPSLNRNHLRSIKVRIPTPASQAKFDEVVEPILMNAEKLRDASQKLKEMRDALLPRLISGKLRVDHLDIQYPPSMKAELAKAA